ncbi:MAG: GNA1162 family protein [Myxococcota bacterium]
MRLLRRAALLLLLLGSAGCVMPGQARRNAYDYGPLVAADPRSVVVAPVVSPLNPEARDWFLATLTAPLAERGYYVFPVFMSTEIAEQAGLGRGPGGRGFAEFSPELATGIAELFHADSVLFVTVKKWGYTSQDLGLDPVGTNEVLFDYRLTDARGQTIWEASQGASLTRGGGDWLTQLWNLFTEPSTEEHQTMLSREVNRMAIEGKPNEMGKRTYTRPAPLLVGPYHTRYEADRARRKARPAGAALPDGVVAAVDRLIAECEIEEGPPTTTAAERQASLEAVETCDLDGDAYPDYLIDDARVACAAGLSFRHGNGGTGILLLKGGADDASLAAGATAFGARIEQRAGAPDRVWLLLGGAYCGQDTAGLSRAEMTACERPLVWDAEGRTLVLAGHDQTRFDLSD